MAEEPLDIKIEQSKYQRQKKEVGKYEIHVKQCQKVQHIYNSGARRRKKKGSKIFEEMMMETCQILWKILT